MPAFTGTAGVSPAASTEGASALRLARFPIVDRHRNGRRDDCGPSKSGPGFLSQFFELRDLRLLFPLRDAPWRPWRTCRLQLFLQSGEISFDELTELSENALKLLGCNGVLVHLRLRRTCG